MVKQVLDDCVGWPDRNNKHNPGHLYHRLHRDLYLGACGGGPAGLQAFAFGPANNSKR